MVYFDLKCAIALIDAMVVNVIIPVAIIIITTASNNLIFIFCKEYT